MKFSYDRSAGILRIRAELHTPSRRFDLRLALDTGAARTLISPSILGSAGYEPDPALDDVPIIFGGGTARLPRVKVFALKALGHAQSDFEILAHQLPSTFGLDGLLGLDFMEGKDLLVSLSKGFVELS